MNSVNPRELLKKVFEIADMLPRTYDDENSFPWIGVYMGVDRNSETDQNLYHIQKNATGGGYTLSTDAGEELTRQIQNCNDFLRIIGNNPIIIIELLLSLDNKIVLFDCRTNDCLDIKNWAIGTFGFGKKVKRKPRVLRYAKQGPIKYRMSGDDDIGSYADAAGITFFGKRRKRTVKKVPKELKVPSKIKKLCKSLKIKMTIKRGSKRVRKSLKQLKKEIKRKLKRVKKKL